MKTKNLRIGMAVAALMACGMAFGQCPSEDKLSSFISDDDMYGFVDVSGNVVIEPQYQNAQNFSEGLAAVEIDNRWGFINEKGEMVIQPMFVYPGTFANGLAEMRDADGMCGFIDKTGEWVIKPQYDEAFDFKCDVASVRVGDWQDGKWGCIDKKGNMVIKPQYKYPFDFKGGVMALTEVDGEKVLINSKGETFMKIPTGSSISLYDNGFTKGWCIFSMDKKKGIINENGWLVEPQYDDIYLYNGVATMMIGDKRGVLNRKGVWVVELEEGVRCGLAKLCDNTLMVFKNGKYGYVNENGWVVEPQYENARNFSEDLAAVAFEYWGNWGYIDKSGKMVIAPQFGRAEDFFEGLAAVNKDDKWGFIDKTGIMVIQPQFDELIGIHKGFDYGKAKVRIGDRVGYVDKNGNFTPEE